MGFRTAPVPAGRCSRHKADEARRGELRGRRRGNRQGRMVRVGWEVGDLLAEHRTGRRDRTGKAAERRRGSRREAGCRGGSSTSLKLGGAER